jgi:hypothetical protein
MTGSGPHPVRFPVQKIVETIFAGGGLKLLFLNRYPILPHFKLGFAPFWGDYKKQIEVF